MINNIISGVMLIIYAYYFFKDVKKSMILLYVFGMVAPNFRIGDTIIPMYIIIFIEMMILFITFRSKWLMSIKFDRKDIALFCIMVYLNVITFFNIIVGNIDEINLLAFFSDWRFWFWYVLIRKLDFDSFDNFITPVLIINFILVLYQFFYPDSVGLFVQLYDKGSYGVIRAYNELGYFQRPVGSMLSPVVLGAYSILCVSFYLTEVKVKYRKLKIVLSIFLGLFAMSKTAILGIPVLIFINVIKNKFNIKTIIKYTLGFAVVLIGIWTVVYFDKVQTNQINYYAQFLLDPFRALDSRYSTEGNVYYFYSILKDYLWFGVGSNEFNGVTIMDSMYIALIAKGGIMLVVIYILWLLDVSRSYLIAIALLLTGFGGSYIFNLLILPFICNGVKSKTKTNEIYEV